MSQHIVHSDDQSRKFVFGWDQPLMTFFLQVHALDKPEEDDQIIAWFGTRGREMYEVEDLVREARQAGFTIPRDVQRVLFLDKDEGR